MPEKREVMQLLLDDIIPNSWNPNEMDTREMAMLVDNISSVGFVSPILVTPVNKNGKTKYRIVDGEHRYRAAMTFGLQAIPAVIAPDFDETTQKKQTIRMNKIKGMLNYKKFNRMVSDMMEREQLDPGDAAYELGFADPDEFNLIRDTMREAMPSKEAKERYDKAVKKVKSVDEIYKVVNLILNNYSDTVPANYVIIPIGKSRTLMLTIDGRGMMAVEEAARTCLDLGMTFDSFLVAVMKNMDVESFIDAHEEELTPADGKTFDDTVVVDEEG